MASVGGAGFKMYRDNEIATQTLLVEQSVQEQVNNRIQQATFFIENPMPAVKLPLKEENTATMPYHVVAGAFRSEANAQKAVNGLVSKGYNARKLKKNQFGLYPVLYGSFTSHAEAQEKMNKIKRTENSEAWILVKEL